MGNYRWLGAGLVLFFSAITWAGESGEIRDPGAFFHSSFGDYSEELEIAREENKKGVFLFFEEDNCPFCARMKATILNQGRVQDYYQEQFQNYRVNVKGEVEISDFSGTPMAEKVFAEKKNRVRATPLMAFYNLDGEMVVRYTGAASSVEEFLLLGQYAAEKGYLQRSFSRYKRQQRKARKP
ncbi:MAG: thioredoxin fold domain-containing protein [Gammaproteobacteria bacterium]|nr:thioredoxin fold domain-containing protein [Gammaproteobacteria bacterium]